jgi:hypothetical protein
VSDNSPLSDVAGTRPSPFSVARDEPALNEWWLRPNRLHVEVLPYIDEHRQRVDAPAHVVWSALLMVLRREMGSVARIAGILGCEPARGTAQFGGRPGEAVPGFRIAEAEPGQRLVLRGRHRFSSYTLTFVLDGEGVCAQTHAVFPGVLGWLYCAAVIGSGGHRVVTRRLLRRVARATAKGSNSLRSV